ncbi:MAG: GNAT family N-acetyltransferase [Acidaminococcus sp.]|jgi:ribosomal protein S18 acetylase RimI-like enzyme|nr:GNAT family N-acetyltransferase [Acidaminococcus sp.]MCI2100884.1 GNAT family N-acetyltransferase [Acidaminococcus sp.]MCI2117315.1 GNAT family N-acetyltransferase [Acidaminococcus sp.]
MEIRVMTINDYEQVNLLWHASSGMQLREIDDSREKVAKFLRRNPETSFVAVEDKIVGAVLAGNDGRRGYLYHLAVAEKFQHRHIGTALVKAAEAALLKEGIPKVGILVFRKNDEGNAFWEKLGYVDRSHLVYRSRALVREAE